MTNPWKDIPLADYEGHMAQVAQAQLLTDVFGEVLKEYSPRSIGVIGCMVSVELHGTIDALRINGGAEGQTEASINPLE